MERILPNHLAQNMKVAAEPKARMRMRTTLPLVMMAWKAAHLEMSMPKGATNITRMPRAMRRASMGIFSKSWSNDSMSRLPTWCSAVPTHKKSRDFAAAWKTSRKMAAQMAAALPMPAHRVIRPRLEMVE